MRSWRGENIVIFEPSSTNFIDVDKECLGSWKQLMGPDGPASGLRNTKIRGRLSLSHVYPKMTSPRKGEGGFRWVNDSSQPNKLIFRKREGNKNGAIRISRIEPLTRWSTKYWSLNWGSLNRYSTYPYVLVNVVLQIVSRFKLEKPGVKRFDTLIGTLEEIERERER